MSFSEDGPRLPRKKNVKTLLPCPVCSKSFGLLDEHLHECFFTNYLHSSRFTQLTLPPLILKRKTHCMKNILQTPPEITLIVSDTSPMSPPSSTKLYDSIDIQDTQCPFCNQNNIESLQHHLKECLENISSRMSEMPDFPERSSPTFPREHLLEPKIFKPPVNQTSKHTVQVPIKPIESKSDEVQSTQYPVRNSITHRFQKQLKEKRHSWSGYDPRSFEQHQRKGRKEKKEATPFNLPLELNRSSNAIDKRRSVGLSVLKLPICTTAPSNDHLVALYQCLKPDFIDFNTIADGTRVAIICLENKALCRMTSDFKIFADATSISSGQKDVCWIIKKSKKTQVSGCRFKNELFNKHLFGRKYFSPINDYLTTCRRNQFSCLNFCKGTREVIMGTATDYSTFRVMIYNCT